MYDLRNKSTQYHEIRPTKQSSALSVIYFPADMRSSETADLFMVTGFGRERGVASLPEFATVPHSVTRRYGNTI